LDQLDLESRGGEHLRDAVAHDAAADHRDARDGARGTRRGLGRHRAHGRSSAMATAFPPPRHKVASPVLPPRCSSAWRSVTSTRAALISTPAAPPSFRPGALPAVIAPPLSFDTAASLASVSGVVSGRIDSSLAITIGSPFRCGIETGTTSLEKRQSAHACA